ncbi:hypothetical protein IIA94_03045 [Patescibacteria group bacterium]|nr:hypothetical protein [Patescibacteria group bacterium]
MTKEIVLATMVDKTPEFEKTPILDEKEFWRFVEQSTSEIANSMVRLSLGPTGSIDRVELVKNTAQVLSQVEVDDLNLQFSPEEIKSSSDEVLSLAIPLAIAKVKAVKRKFPDLDSRAKKALDNFKDRVSSLLGPKRTAVALLALATACSAGVGVEQISTGTPSQEEPVAPEVSAVPTAKFDFSFMKRPGQGGELEPFDGTIVDSEDGNEWRMVEEDYELVGSYPGTFDGWVDEESIPEDEREEGIRWGLWSNGESRGRVRFEKVSLEENQQFPVEKASEELSEEKISELAEELVCVEGPTCINEVVGGPNYISVEVISTGMVRNIDLKDSTTGDVIGSATVAEAVTRDVEENPVLINVLLQAEVNSEPGVNQYPTSYSAMQVSLKHRNGKEVSLQEINSEARQIHSPEEWRVLISEGTMWTFLFQKNGLFGTAGELASTDLTHPENVKVIQEFLESKGKSGLGDQVLVPAGTQDRF